MNTLKEIHPSPINRYSEVTCVQNVSLNYFGETVTQQKIANCEFYNLQQDFTEGEFNDDIYYCIKCKNGFNGKMRQFGSSDNHQIYSCYEDSECGVSYLPGLLLQHINTVSCF